MDEEQKKKIANQAALAMYATLTGIPPEIQLEAALILVRTLFITSVKQIVCISLFNAVVKKMRDELKLHLKTHGAKK